MTKARIIADYAGTGATTDLATQAELDAVSTVASAALPKAGGTMTGDLVPATPLSNRNMIINGAMNVAQRGTSFTSQLATGKTYTLDRWASEWFTGTETAKATITQDALGTTDLPRVNEGLSYAYKIDCTTAIADQNANTANLQTFTYRIEGQDAHHLRYGTSSAQTVCLSFWFKSPKAGIHAVAASQPDNTHRCYVREFTIASADTWQKIQVTFPGDASGVINNDNGLGFRLDWPLYSGTSKESTKDEWRGMANYSFTTSNQQNLLDDVANNIYITGVQLELGSTATPFEHRSYGEELARCQRYYYKMVEGNSKWIGSGAYYNANVFVCYKQWPVEMRATPTIASEYTSGSDLYQILGNGVDYCDSLSLTRAHTLGGGFDVGGNVSGTSGHGGVLSTGDSSTYVAVQAEL